MTKAKGGQPARRRWERRAMPRPRTPRPGRPDPPARRRVPPGIPTIASVGRRLSGREPNGDDEERGGGLRCLERAPLPPGRAWRSRSPRGQPAWGRRCAMKRAHTPSSAAVLALAVAVGAAAGDPGTARAAQQEPATPAPLIQLEVDVTVSGGGGRDRGERTHLGLHRQCAKRRAAPRRSPGNRPRSHGVSVERRRNRPRPPPRYGARSDP